MCPIGLTERETQDRVIALFREKLGHGDWTDRIQRSTH
jgi:hypothetical protein